MTRIKKRKKDVFTYVPDVITHANFGDHQLWDFWVTGSDFQFL